MQFTDHNGTITQLWRYPVKSMLGERCAHVDIDERGVQGDRRFAVRTSEGKFGSGKTTVVSGISTGCLPFRPAPTAMVSR